MITPTKDSKNPRSILHQSLWVWFFTMLALRLSGELQAIPALSEYIGLITAAILIYVPLYVLGRQKQNTAFFENSLKDLAHSLLWVTLACLIIFPLLETANHFYQAWFFNQQYQGGHWKNLARFFFSQLVLVAFPEEIFYRGYLQGQLNQVWPAKRKFLGAPVGKGLVYTSLLFAFSHSLIQLQWWHFAIFFPSLVFGWLREKTGAVTAGAIFHAVANTYTYWVVLNYR